MLVHRQLFAADLLNFRRGFTGLEYDPGVNSFGGHDPFEKLDGPFDSLFRWRRH